MKNLEYKLVYGDIDEELEVELINFWISYGDISKEESESSINKFVLVLLDTSDVIVDEYGVKRDLFGNKVYGKIVGFSYVDKDYLEFNELYYFYNAFIPFSEYNTDLVKKNLYKNTREHLKILQNIEEYSERTDIDLTVFHRVDSGDYIGIALKEKDDFLISKFGFKFDDRSNYWYDNF